MGQPPPGTRAIELNPPTRYFSPFLDLYGRPLRYALPERDTSPSIAQALHVWAGDTYTSKLTQEGGRLDQLLASEESDGLIVEQLYLAAFSRLPDQNERTALEAKLAEVEEPARRPAFADLTWALLTSREFAYNH